MKIVLITGATGFLGGYLVGEFAAHGYSVIAAGRNKLRLAELAGRRVQTLEASLEDLAKLTLDVDFVVHAAALSTVWGNWQDFYKNNVEGTKHVLKFCTRNGVKRLVYVSSPSVYARAADMLNVTEDEVNPNNNLNNYIRSKIAAEKYLRGHADSLVVILRPRGLIGAGDTSIAPRLVQANKVFGIPLSNNGQNLVDLTCVENVALACRLGIEAPRAAGNTYNISNGTPLPMKSLCEQLFAALNQKPRFRSRNASFLYAVASVVEFSYKLLRIETEPPITRYTVTTLAYSQTLSIDRARQDLGYAPIVSITEGIKRYAEATHA